MKTFLCALLFFCTGISAFTQGNVTEFNNKWLKVSFSEQNKWRISQLTRMDGRDVLAIVDDGFEVVRFNGNRYTLDDYKVKEVVSNTEGEIQKLTFTYVPDQTGTDAPAEVHLEYQLGKGPELHKTVTLKLAEGDSIDRLEVWRFSTTTKSSRGGDNGQPVFAGDWFLGLDYPFFYSRHSDDFKQPGFYYSNPYNIDLEGGDKEYAPRLGLITVFHFPNKAKKLADGSWGIISKRGVIGLPEKPGDGAELALYDYIQHTRRPAKSHLHFNNWYTPEAKKLTVDGFGTQLTRKFKESLARYGAKLDAMVPDDGWQDTKTYTYIYEQSKTHEPLEKIAAAVRDQGVDFGIWVTFSGAGIPVGEQLGYRSGMPNGVSLPGLAYKRNFFDISNEKYLKDLKESMRWLVQECGVRYFKHDFNFMFHGYAKQRHAREECADITFDLMAYERSLAPDLLINFTNGTMFTPFFLQYADYIWMNSSDNGSTSVFPTMSKLELATSYRDNHFYKNWGNPSKTVRPLVSISDFMTHGVLHSNRVRYFEEGDQMIDWCNYVTMYVARGTLLKELYLSPDLFTEPMWEALGKACAWSQNNVGLLKNSWFFGGDCDKGETYGFVSWQGDRGILTVRNPDRMEKELKVPFDKTVYFRGANGQSFKARAIYPFVEEMPWALTSGKDFTIRIPGDAVMVFELEAGKPLKNKMIEPKKLPKFSAETDAGSFKIKLNIPNEDALRYDLVVLGESEKPFNVRNGEGASVFLFIDGAEVKANKILSGKDYGMAIFDLKPFRGRKIEVKGTVENTLSGGNPVLPTIWLVCDRPVKEDSSAVKEDKVLPMQISWGFRHQSQLLVESEK